MTRLPDATDAAPVRRMSVARAVVEGGNGSRAMEAQAAAVLAAKQADRVIPGAHPAALSDAYLEATEVEGRLHVTFTVQAYARVALEQHALLGLGAAVAVFLRGTEGSCSSFGVVQNVG